MRLVTHWICSSSRLSTKYARWKTAVQTQGSSNKRLEQKRLKQTLGTCHAPSVGGVHKSFSKPAKCSYTTSIGGGRSVSVWLLRVIKSMRGSMSCSVCSVGAGATYRTNKSPMIYYLLSPKTSGKFMRLRTPVAHDCCCLGFDIDNGRVGLTV